MQARNDLENAGRITGELEHNNMRLLKIGLKGLRGCERHRARTRH